MRQSIADSKKSLRAKKRSRGRPVTGIGPAIGLRLYPDLKVRIDAWRAAQPHPISEPEAIRQLLAIALDDDER
jgi:hypothetical protein